MKGVVGFVIGLNIYLRATLKIDFELDHLFKSLRTRVVAIPVKSRTEPTDAKLYFHDRRKGPGEFRPLEFRFQISNFLKQCCL